MVTHRYYELARVRLYLKKETAMTLESSPLYKLCVFPSIVSLAGWYALKSIEDKKILWRYSPLSHEVPTRKSTPEYLP
jgi:hypothetical protein